MTDNQNSSDKNVTADIVVSTVEGRVKGYFNSAKDIYTFKGLHYGESTAGTGRFRPPQRVKPWEGIRDATAYGHSSPQPRAAVTETPDDSMMSEPAEQSEDCLVLNVWTPGLDGKRPVMVWLHDGGFASGSGSGALYEGTSLSKRDTGLPVATFRGCFDDIYLTGDGIIEGFGNNLT
jgi:para-nitrobenzyl esterase